MCNWIGPGIELKTGGVLQGLPLTDSMGEVVLQVKDNDACVRNKKKLPLIYVEGALFS